MDWLVFVVIVGAAGVCLYNIVRFAIDHSAGQGTGKGE